MVNMHMKIWSMSLIIRKMKIKTMMKCHLADARWLSHQKDKIITVGENVE